MIRLRRSEYAWASVLCAGVLALASAINTGLFAAEVAADDLFYVLLRNGEVLRGSLERDEDHYLIRRNGSAVLRIPYKDISHVGPKMQVLYEHKANRIIEFRADEHLDLASWCLQNSLEPQATHHILRAETIDPFHPHLSLMKARLERFLALGDEAESYESQIALLAAVGNEPIPITRAPLYDVQAEVSSLPPSSTPSASPPPTSTPSASLPPTSPPSASLPPTSPPPTSLPGPTANDTHRPRETSIPAIPNIDPPPLISETTAADLAKELELPELIPAGGAPPAIPAVTINQELIRQVEEKLADATTSNTPTESREPKQLVAKDLLHDAQPLEPVPKSRSDSPANSPFQDSAIREKKPEVGPTADLNGLSGQKLPQKPSTSVSTTTEPPSNGDQRQSQGQGQSITPTNQPAIVEHQQPTEYLAESLTESQRPDPAEQREQAADVPDVALPPELIAAYVANVQPMLLTRCAAANCHGHASDTEFKLHRVSDRRPSRVMTMRNLASTLEQLDTANPADSPLFTWGQTVHGQTHSKLLAITNVQQQTLLLQWLHDVADPPTKPKSPRTDDVVDRHRVFAEGAERISLRKIKQSKIRWREPTPRANERWQSAEPANRDSTDVQFLSTPATAKPR